MLKWTISKPGCRQADNHGAASERSRTQTSCRSETTRLKNSAQTPWKRNTRQLAIVDKSCNPDNQYTSTPLSTKSISVTIGTHPISLEKVENVSKIRMNRDTPPSSDQLLKNNIHQSLSSTSTHENCLPSPYASTLPTFDIEYSPCSAIPGPILVLRGVTIGDSYFEKPRYLNEENNDADNTKLKNKIESSQQVQFQHNDSSVLSSSKMGDVTLDKMIEAILESARKEKRQTRTGRMRNRKPKVFPAILSPTYTPADDPASDLNEFYDFQNAKYCQKQPEECNTKNNKFNIILNEREVRTPERLHDNGFTLTHVRCNSEDVETSHFMLRRQRAVRKKQKACSIFKTSTQKCSSALKQFALNMNLKDAVLDTEITSVHKVARCNRSRSNNISPDSGRNSASDLEESNDNLNLTKRKLSFSTTKYHENEDVQKD